MPGSRIKVLAVTNLWPEDGSYRGVFVREQVDALRRLDVDTDVEVVAQQRGKSDYLLSAARVRRRLRRERYDLVHFHYGLTAIAAPCTRRVPSVLSLYGSDVNVPWQKRISRFGMTHTDARIYVSRPLLSRMDDRNGHVIPMGVDLSLFRPADRMKAREALGIAPDDLVVLFGAHPANPVKGYPVFRAVLDRLAGAGHPVRELLLPGQSRDEVPIKFAAADLLLFTSLRGTEGSPGVLKEAVAMGLPVVSVDVGDASQTLSGVTPSAVVEFGDGLVEALADRCAEVLTTRARSNGPETAGRFDWALVAQRIREVYDEVRKP